MEGLTHFFKRFTGGTDSRNLVLGGFGKLRTYAEHQTKLGQSSGSLVELRGALYFDGILKLSPAWQKLSPEDRMGFDHWLVWVRPGSVVLGRIIASADLAGREVPLVIAADISNVALEKILRSALETMDAFARRCSALPTRESVDAAFSSEEGALEAVLKDPGVVNGGVSAAEREGFFFGVKLDADGMALARLLHTIEVSWAPYAAQRGSKAAKVAGPGVALRFPTAAGQIALSVLLWEQFVRSRIDPETPRLYVVPMAGDWVDVIVGKIEGSHFFGLRANRKGLVPETEVPHAVSAELLAYAKNVMGAWQSGAPLELASKPPPATSLGKVTTAGEGSPAATNQPTSQPETGVSAKF